MLPTLFTAAKLLLSERREREREREREQRKNCHGTKMKINSSEGTINHESTDWLNISIHLVCLSELSTESGKERFAGKTNDSPGWLLFSLSLPVSCVQLTCCSSCLEWVTCSLSFLFTWKVRGTNRQREKRGEWDAKRRRRGRRRRRRRSRRV